MLKMKENWPPEVTWSLIALHKAVRAGTVALVKLLLWTGADVNASDSYDQTALHLACRSEHRNKKVVKQLLKSGAEVNAQDWKGETPLHVACKPDYGNHQKVVKFLLRAGAKTNVQNYRGKTPLHMACWLGSRENVLLLLRNGAKVNIADNDGLTALHYVVCSMKFDVSLTNSLLHNNLNVNATDSEGMSSLHYFVWRTKSEEYVSAILSEGADVNLQDSKGQTALHIACELKMRTIVRLLLDNGAKLELRNRLGRTALHLAVMNFSMDIIVILLNKGADVNVKDMYGDTPLHLAFSSMHKCAINSSTIWRYEIVNTLLKKGANVDEKNKLLKTPFEECLLFIQPFCEQGNNLNPHETQKRRKIEKAIIMHIIKLKAANIPVEIDIKQQTLGNHLYVITKSRCCLEMKQMRSTKVLDDMSLSNVLFQRNKPFLFADDGLSKLQEVEQFLYSSTFLQTFPLYGHLLRMTFQRSKLLTLAVHSFYSEERKQMMKQLPCLVAELVMNYLNEEDLKNFLKSEENSVRV